MNKKILTVFVLILTLAFSETALASLTFTTDAITGTSASSIDLGSGNDLNLQTTGNGAINLGSGLLTSVGGATFGGTVQAGKFQVGVPITGDVLYFSTYDSSININKEATFNNTTFPAGQGIKVTRTAPAASTNFDLMGGQGISVEGISNYATPNFYIYGQDISAVASGTGTAAYILGSQAIATNKSAAKQAIAYLGRLSYYKPQVTPVTAESSAFYSEIDTHTATGLFTKVDNYFATGAVSADNSVASWYAYRAEFPRGSGAGAIGRWAGVAISPDSPANASVGATLIPTNKTLVLLGQDNIPDGNWSIYSADVDPSYFAGPIKAPSLQLTTGTKPTCDVTTRGTQWYVAGGAGVADTMEVCRKDASDAYAWVTVY